MSESVLREYGEKLRYKQMLLEQLELLLHRMHRLAEEAMVEECTEEKRLTLQEELNALKVKIDEIGRVLDDDTKSEEAGSV